MCQTCIDDGSIHIAVYRMIESFLELYPEAENGNAHIVLGDSNLGDYHIDFCLAAPLDTPVREFLLFLRAIPENVRVPIYSDEVPEDL